MDFGSPFIQAAFPVINNARNFIKNSLIWDGGTYIVQNLDYATLPIEDKELLQEWRQGVIDETILRRQISENIKLRKNNS